MQRIWRDKTTNNFMINRHIKYDAEIEKVFVYDSDQNIYDITNDFKSIQASEVYLPVFLYMFPRFNGNCFVVRCLKRSYKDKPKYDLYIHKGEKMQIGA